MPRAGAVELREVDALPPAEVEAAPRDRDGDVSTDEHGLDVRGAVALGVPVVPGIGHEPRERDQEIALHIWVGVLVHEHGGGRVRDRDDADPLADVRLLHLLGDPLRDVDGLGWLRGLDAQAELLGGHATEAFAPRSARVRARPRRSAFPPLTMRPVFPRGRAAPDRTAASVA